MERPENPPAFPRDHRHLGHNGMDLRDWFAGQALIGIVALNTEGSYAADATNAYKFADAMIAERAKREGGSDADA